MKTLKESLLSDIENTLSTGEGDIKKSLGVPTMKDFWIPKYGDHNESRVFWPCGEKLKKYKNCAWLPYNCPGITFKLYERNGQFKMTAHFNSERGKYSLGPQNMWLRGWCIDEEFKGKNRTYCKKVILSIIEHLAMNESAFEELIKYIKEVVQHYILASKYDDGTSPRVRSYYELFKIKD